MKEESLSIAPSPFAAQRSPMFAPPSANGGTRTPARGDKARYRARGVCGGGKGEFIDILQGKSGLFSWTI